MTPKDPNLTPNTILTLSAHTDTDRGYARTPDVACPAISTDCTREAGPVVYLDGVPKGQALCASCAAFAARAGMNPKTDRRAVPRIPEWRRRALAGQGVAKDYTRQGVA